MLQAPRLVRPHDPADCIQCSPQRHGHQLCQAPGCDAFGEHVTLRHATQAEYDAIPEPWRPIDGIAHIPVLACDEHAEATARFCDHPEQVEAACPTCSASGEDPCLSANGSPRTIRHRARSNAQPIPEPCLHAHRENCGIFDGCQCAGDDPNPVRQPRIVAQPDHADGSHSKLPWTLVKPIVEAIDIPWWTVRHYATVEAQDTTPALDVTYAVLDQDGNVIDDGHGHDTLAAVRISLEQSQPRPPESIPVPAYADTVPL